MTLPLNSFQARFVHGSPIMVDHTPDEDVHAGDVILTNHTVRIAHLDIAAGELGSLAAEGGIYECTGDQQIDEDEVVYWDDVTNKVTPDVTVGVLVFGVTVGTCSGNGATVRVRHDPALRVA